MRVVYLHGFASGPSSSKAQFFRRKFQEAGVPFEAPALDRGDFENLTITGQLEVVDEAVSRNVASNDGGTSGVVLMGSSLGGYLAALYAAAHPDRIDKLVLLAPAFEFLERWKARLRPEEWAQWERQGWAPIFHYGTKSERRLGRQFLEDGARFPAIPDFHQFTMILHGTNDTVVPFQVSYKYVQEHAHARLVALESGHELTDVLEDLWRETAAFLGIA
jgi:hypothetical protein